MNPDSWERAAEVFDAALRLQPNERSAFLDEACSGQDTLRERVEGLLANHEEAQADGFLARAPAVNSMQLPRGTQLAHYEIVEPIGKGGMGEVYRATDSKLGRDVAIKVLPEEFAQDQERVDRFEREARFLAQLNHPNIATLYGLEEHDGQGFLVMELVEGETLAERITRGPMPIDETIPLFIQIAEGLEAAHGKGIIHRDLKPANIKLTPQGKVKILDFGLAKAFVKEFVSDAKAESPTITRERTRAGVILGTTAYMSPEQTRGQRLDKRTDIWSFGCALYEALAGRSAFAEKTLQDTIAKILERDPTSIRQLRREVPPDVERLIMRCLEKNADARYPSAAELLSEIAKCEMRLASRAKALITALKRPAVVISIAAVLIAAAIAMSFWMKRAEQVRWARNEQTASRAPAAEPSPANAAIRRGRHFRRRYAVAPRPEDFDLAMEAFQEALAVEPDRAVIPAEIATLYVLKMQSGGEIARLIPEVELWALRAIELDSDSSLAWNSLYNAERYRVRPNHRKLVESAFRASGRRKDPGYDPQVVSFYSVVLGLEGYRYELQLQQLNSWWYVNAAFNLSMLSRHDEGLELVDEALKIDLDFVGGLLQKASLLARLGRFEEARERIADLPPIPDAYQVVVTQIEFFMVLATGDANAVREGLPTQIAILLHPEIPFTFRWPYMVPPIIEALAANGYVEEALDVMSQFHEAGLGDPPYDWLRLSLLFDPIREDPRFQAVEAHAKENFDLMLEHLDRARDSSPLPAELEQARVDLMEQLGD